MVTLFLLFTLINAQPNIFKSMQIPLIYGGYNASQGQFPYIVSIAQDYWGFNHVCTGSIIKAKWILTAKHCIEKDMQDDYKILAGTIEKGEGIKYSIESTFRHNSIDGDIALIKVKETIKFNNLVQPIPIFRQYVPGNKNVVAAGFGQTEYGSENVLKFLHTKTITNEECVSRVILRIKPDITPNILCVYIGVGRNFCFGDSGGPVVYDGQLVGVVSFKGGPMCGDDYPDGLIRVSNYANWIDYITDTQ